MRGTINYILNELKDTYPETEIRALTRLMLEHVCGLNFTQQILKKDELLPAPCRKAVIHMVMQLKNHEPIQYILGETEFADLRLLVSPAVLIPRPETVELVEWAALSELPGVPIVLDAGTGSGCIALALKKKLKDASVLAVDVSEQALYVARQNAAINNMVVQFAWVDLLKWENHCWQNFDLIISNPPYVRQSEKKAMAGNVLQYEPAGALFVNDSDPLVFYRRISELACKYLNANGWLYFEINEAFGHETHQLLEQHGFREVELKKDLSGKDRMIRCKK